jgi:hypothetical protein
VSEEERPEAQQEPEAEEIPDAQEPPDAGASAGGAPSEEEIRRQIDEQLRKVRVHDLLMESLAGILNLTARRIAKEDERDLEQARLGIEVARAVVGLLEEEPARQVRDAISQLQVLYASQAPGGEGQGGGGEPGARPEGGPAPRSGPSESGAAPGQGRQPPPRLWTPGSG